MHELKPRFSEFCIVLLYDLLITELIIYSVQPSNVNYASLRKRDKSEYNSQKIKLKPEML